MSRPTVLGDRRNLLRGPASGIPLAAGPAGFPGRGHQRRAPVNPLTVCSLNEQLEADGHRPDGTSQPLTTGGLKELEGIQVTAALSRRPAGGVRMIVAGAGPAVVLGGVRAATGEWLAGVVRRRYWPGR